MEQPGLALPLLTETRVARRMHHEDVMSKPTAPATYACKTELFDARCTDGCCGNVFMSVTSRRTGRVITVDFHDVPRDRVRVGRIVDAVVDSRPLSERNGELESTGRVLLNGTATVRFTLDELNAILHCPGARIAA